MADTFVKWYYELLNAHSSEFRPDHFFPDASAKICLQSHNRAQPPELIQVQNSGKEVRFHKNYLLRRHIHGITT